MWCRYQKAVTTDQDGPQVFSMEKIDAILQRDHAQLWINHDKAQRDRLKLAPEFYE
jgi:hypothetical protein